MRSRRAERHDMNWLCPAWIGGEGIEVVLETLSYEGFGVRCGRTLAIGSAISIDLPGNGPTRGVVRWSIGGKAGGLFRSQLSDEAVTKIATLARGDGGGIRMVERSSAVSEDQVGVRHGTIQLADGTTGAAILLGLTGSGAIIEYPVDLAAGTDLLVRFGELRTQAVAMWSANGRAGLQFYGSPRL